MFLLRPVGFAPSPLTRENIFAGRNWHPRQEFPETDEKNHARIGTIKVANDNRGENLVDEWTIVDR